METLSEKFLEVQETSYKKVPAAPVDGVLLTSSPINPNLSRPKLSTIKHFMWPSFGSDYITKRQVCQFDRHEAKESLLHKFRWRDTRFLAEDTGEIIGVIVSHFSGGFGNGIEAGEEQVASALHTSGAEVG